MSNPNLKPTFARRLFDLTNEKTSGYDGGLKTDHSTIVNIPNGNGTASANTTTDNPKSKSNWRKSKWRWNSGKQNGPTEKNSQPKRPLPPIENGTAFLKKAIPAPPQLVEGLIEQGTKVAIAGGSKTFKTWQQLNLAISVSHGIPWMGRNTKKGNVLFINLEISEFHSQGRAIQILKARERDLQLDNLDIWNLRGHAASYHELLPRIQDRIRQGYALIIVDPIYKVYGDADENSAGDITKLLNAIEELVVQSGATVAFAAHFSKGNQSAKEAIDRISGSGVFARDPDTLLIFTAHEQPDCFVVEPTLRNFAPVDPFCVRWKCPLMVEDDSLDPTKLLKRKGASKKHNPITLLKAIADTNADNPISVAAWAKRAGIPRPTLMDNLSEWQTNGWVATVGEGNNKRQYLTVKGHEIIAQ
jgi:AAA domain